jgi:hypothetical protein
MALPFWHVLLMFRTLLMRRLIQGTQWPAGSSVGRMVARIARGSRGRFLGWASKPWSSRDFVESSNEWWLAEATLSSRGFQWFTTKPLGSLFDPQSQGRRPKCSSTSSVWPVGRTGLTGGYRSDWWSTPIWPVYDDAFRRLRSEGHALGSQSLCWG